MIEERFEKDNRSEYFAIRYSVDENENIDEKFPIMFVREIKKGEEGVNGYRTEQKNERYFFLPNLVKDQRDGIFAVGQAGTGKSFTLDQFVKLYKMINTRNRVLYFSMNVAQIDKSLTQENYEIMDMQEFCDSLEEIIENLDEMKKMTLLFHDMLIVFDDIGKLSFNKKYEKLFWTFISASLEDMRKVNVSVYLIGHTSRTGQYGKILKEEINKYIVYPKSLQTSNDRIIDAYFGFKTHTKKRLFSTNDRWVCIDCHRKIAISPSEVYFIPLFKDNE